MEAKTHIPKTKIERSGLIDGLPNSYVVNYILQRQKTCEICNKLFKQKHIDKNEIVCIETFEFYHKSCLNTKNIIYAHLKENDKSSCAQIINSKI